MTSISASSHAGPRRPVLFVRAPTTLRPFEVIAPAMSSACDDTPKLAATRLFESATGPKIAPPASPGVGEKLPLPRFAVNVQRSTVICVAVPL